MGRRELTAEMPETLLMRGRGVYLRPLKRGDLKGGYHRWFNDPETCKYNQHARFPDAPHTMEDEAKYLDEIKNSDRHAVFAICRSNDGRHVGNVSVQFIDWECRSAELAIIISREYWGQGYGSEACRMATDYAFRKLKLHRLYSACFASNKAMRRLLEKVGMQKEGVRIEAIYKNGKYEDVISYGMLESEYRGYATRKAN